LGTLGGDFSFPTAISSNGRVTGYSSTSILGTSEVAFLYDKGQMTSLARVAPEGNSFPSGVNASGDIVGYAYGTPVVTPFSSAFVYAQGKFFYPDRDEGSDSGAQGINDAGQYIVTSNPSGTQTVLTTLYTHGIGTVLPSIGGDQLFGVAINAHGHVTGIGLTSSGEAHPFLYADAKTTDVGLPPGTTSFSMGALNDRDEVVCTGEAGWYLFASGTWTSLGTPTAPFSQLPSASSINDGGVIVGSGDDAAYDTHGFLYRNGRMTDLNTLTVGALAKYVTVNIPVAINNAGQIAASGTDSRTGWTHAYLLTPLPARYLVTVITEFPAHMISQSGIGLANGLSIKELADNISLQDESLITLTDVAGVDELGRIFAKGYSKQTGELQFYVLTATASGDG